MEEPRYHIEYFTEDSLEHGFPEVSFTCVSPIEVAEAVAHCTRERTGIAEVRITFIRKEPDWDWAQYWRVKSQHCREYEWSFRKEVAKYLPAIDIMSFAGPEAIVKWIFNHVTINKKDS
jgi:hypothetical protein